MNLHRYLYVLALFVWLFAVPHGAFADELIHSFDSSIEVHTDATLSVTETIQYDFGAGSRHGIFRTLPTSHPEKGSMWYKDRVVRYDIARVERDGITEPYTLEEGSGEVTVKIGDPASTISGRHTYTISYVAHGALMYPKGEGPELYWNVTGNGWQVGIEQVRATLIDPDSILRMERSCYYGSVGENTSCRIVASTTGIMMSAQNLLPHQGMTVANALSSQVAVMKIEENNWKALFIFVGLPLGLILAFLYGTSVYRYRTKHKIDLPVVAQYEPYEGFLPMYAGALIDGKLDPRDITGGILYLAEQGYIKIKKTERKAFFLFEVEDYEFELLRTLDETILDASSREVLTLIFNTLTVGEKVALSTLASSKRSENQRTIRSLTKRINEDLVTAGFYEKAPIVSFSFNRIARYLKPLAMVTGLVLVFAAVAVGFIFLLFAVGIIVLPFLLSRKTEKGYEAINYLKGYKLYLSVAEKDRIAFHNAPSKSPTEFLKHLPYAIAFGVEKEWAEAFKDITIPAPDWYDGGASGGFSAVNLTSSIGAFSTAFASSSGSSSASSGGGSSGGGSGGGGGGSW